MQNLDLDEARTIMAQLEQALYNHEQWHQQLIRVLVTRSPHDAQDVTPLAHRQCRFGQWYYRMAHVTLRQHPAFQAIEDAHRHMHEAAARLLRLTAQGLPIEAIDYDGLSNAVARLRLQIQTLQRELADMLYLRDPLTGVNSRITLLTYLREQKELVKRKVHPSSIVLIDLDNFKQINDCYGHLAGDGVLAAVGRYLLGNVRCCDKVFRYGGEEFLVAMVDATAVQAHRLAERLRNGMAALAIPVPGHEPVSVTFSSGIAQLNGDAFVELAIDCADKALYGAKSAGRNRTCIWEGTPNGGSVVCAPAAQGAPHPGLLV